MSHKMIDLPNSTKLPIGELSCVFNDTTNSYKFYWFLAILEEIKLNNSKTLSFENLFNQMLSQVIFPLEYYKLSFGKMDGFKDLGGLIKKKLILDFRPNAKPLIEQIDSALDFQAKQEISKRLRVLNRWVPYRFIRPFFKNEIRGLVDSKVNRTIERLAHETHTSNPLRCPYYIKLDEIVINEHWFEFFKENIGILRSFTLWHLVQFLQKNNPNIIGISQKLFKPEKRNIKINIDSWKCYLKIEHNIRCIYSGDVLLIPFTLDHFVPWSYIVHDSSWNLVPASKSINSSKGDCLPNLTYLTPFTELQYRYFKFLIDSDYEKLVEEYCLLFRSNIDEVKKLTQEVFKNLLGETIRPIIQIAGSNGFDKDWIYSKR
jgi:hypothetical protein